MNQKHDLVAITEYAFPVHASPGAELRAQAIAVRCERANAFMATLFEIEPTFSLFILTREHWPENRVYGMPHCSGKSIIVTGSRNALWQQFERTLETSESAVARSAYDQPDGSLDVSPFFDLLTVHELAHVFHNQADRDFQRLWLKELFCNLSLHAYVAEKEPALFEQLEALPTVIAAQDPTNLQYQTLSDFERFYSNQTPYNYGWYQCRLHLAAKQIWESAGTDACSRLWYATEQLDASMSNDEFAEALRVHVHPSLERVWSTWPS